MALAATFWGIWSLFAPVPTTTSILISKDNYWQLPVAISRWWDIPTAGLWALLLALFFGVIGKAKEQKEDLIVGLVVGLGIGLVVGLGIGLVVGLGFGLGAGLVVGLGFGLSVELGAGLGFGLSVELGAGLGFGLGIGLSAGLGFGLSVGLGFGLGFGLSVGLGAGLGFLIVHTIPAFRWLGRWLAGE